MGTWGTAIFSDDFASDIRSDFKRLIGDGLTPEEATGALLKEHSGSLNDPDNGPPFWLGLASTQWTLGRMVPKVRDRALKIIDSGEDLLRWDDDASLIAKRQKVLAALREELLSPPPAPKKVSRVFRDSNSWRVGSVVAYKLLDGNLCLLRVVGHYRDKGGRSPIVEVMDWSGREVPSRWTMTWLKPRIGYEGQTKYMIAALSERDIPTDRLTHVGMVLRLPRTPRDFGFMFWKMLDEHLVSYFENEV